TGCWTGLRRRWRSDEDAEKTLHHGGTEDTEEYKLDFLLSSFPPWWRVSVSSLSADGHTRRTAHSAEIQPRRARKARRRHLPSPVRTDPQHQRARGEVR